MPRLPSPRPAAPRALSISLLGLSIPLSFDGDGVSRCAHAASRTGSRHKRASASHRAPPTAQAHRLDSYVLRLGVAFERLTYLKEYRTPQAFRAFARVYTLFFGALYGPYYVHLGRGASSEEDNLGLSIAFAVSMQLAMSGLLNVFLGMEDPFWRTDAPSAQFDAIRVPELVELTRRQLLRIERESTQSWTEPLRKEPWSAGGSQGGSCEGLEGSRTSASSSLRRSACPMESRA